MGKLYVVPTPIGNLNDMTFRAVEVLKNADWVAVEDSRVTSKLLKHFGIQAQMVLYEDFKEEKQVAKVLEKLKIGDVALVSDAGMPGISDPGYLLINKAIELGYEVVPLPGANAVLPALVGSGFSMDRFVFLGFLPKKETAKRKVLEEFKQDKKTLVIYESPHRILVTLKTTKEVLGPRKVCVAREISKKFEDFIRLDVDEAINVFNENKVAGEIVIVVQGAAYKQEIWSEAQIAKRLGELALEGLSLADAAKKVAHESGWNKKPVYQLGLKKNEN